MNPEFDERGLMPVVLQNARTRKVMMLGFMNEEAWRKTLEEKKVHFFSRSRSRLWLKGETSGNIQAVHAVHLDCDSDAALITVEPKGPVCHTGRETCFFIPVLSSDEGATDLNFWEELPRLIKERKEDPRPGSYTSWLFRQGKEKICRKVGEEAIELILACMSGTKREVIHETADLLYHLFVLLSEAGVEWEDVASELSRRRKDFPQIPD